MKINELETSKHKQANRRGRGIAAGRGKTAGRGTKGQNSRTGSKRRPGFEGGQNPLMQRLPKLPGFRSHHTQQEVVYTGQLQAIGKVKVDTTVLAEAGLISSAYVSVKVLLKGEINKNLTVEAQSVSEQAKKAIEKAGGTFKSVEQLKRPTTKRETKESKKKD